MLTHKHLKKNHRLKIEEHCPIDQNRSETLKLKPDLNLYKTQAQI